MEDELTRNGQVPFGRGLEAWNLGVEWKGTRNVKMPWYQLAKIGRGEYFPIMSLPGINRPRLGVYSVWKLTLFPALVQSDCMLYHQDTGMR